MRSKENSGSQKKTVASVLQGMTAKQWTVLLLLGLLLVVMSLPVKKDSERTEGTIRETAEEKAVWQRAEAVNPTELEARLAAVLENTEGVGRVQVLLMTGVGQQGFYSTENTEVTGVLIVAEGADNPVIKQNIQQAVMALFQIEAHKIKIMKMK